MDDPRGRFVSHREVANYARGFLLVAAVSTIVAPSQRSVLTSEEAQHRRQQRDEFSRFVPCIASFIDEYFEQPEWVSLVLPDDPRDVLELAEPLMSELRGRSAFYTLTVGMISAIETYEGAANAVILSENASALGDICPTNHCKHECDFALALTRPFENETSFLAEADELIRRLCLRSIFELEILALVGDSVVVAGSPSSRTDGLYTAADAAVLARCEQGDSGVIQWRRSVVKEERTRASFERVVNVAMYPNFPYAVPVNTSGLRFGGIEGAMVEEIARSLKIRLNRELIGWTNASVDSELELRLYDMMDTDVVFGGFLWDYDPKTEYTNSYGIVHVAWIVPIHANVSLRGLIAPFSANVWYAIICALLIGGLVKRFFIRDITFLDIASLLFGVAVNRQPVKISDRIQFIAWALFGFFVTQLYLGSMADQLMNATDLQIDTIEELMASGMKLGGTAQLQDLLGPPDDDDDEEMRHFRERFVALKEEDYVGLITDLKAGRKDNLALLVMLNLTDVRHMADIGHAHIIKEPMGVYPLALATWRGFSYLRDINFKIQVLLQTGIVEFWSETMTIGTNHYEKHDEEDDAELDLQDITPAFLLLIMGYVGGCLLLVLEILFYPSPILL